MQVGNHIQGNLKLCKAGWTNLHCSVYKALMINTLRDIIVSLKLWSWADGVNFNPNKYKTSPLSPTTWISSKGTPGPKKIDSRVCHFLGALSAVSATAVMGDLLLCLKY